MRSRHTQDVVKMIMYCQRKRRKIQQTYTTKPVLRGHLWDKQKVAL